MTRFQWSESLLSCHQVKTNFHPMAIGVLHISHVLHEAGVDRRLVKRSRFGHVASVLTVRRPAGNPCHAVKSRFYLVAGRTNRRFMWKPSISSLIRSRTWAATLCAEA